MSTMEHLMGVKRADMEEMREVKVKLPVRQLLKLHYMKLTAGTTFSDVVADALLQYFHPGDAPVAAAASA